MRAARRSSFFCFWALFLKEYHKRAPLERFQKTEPRARHCGSPSRGNVSRHWGWRNRSTRCSTWLSTWHQARCPDPRRRPRCYRSRHWALLTCGPILSRWIKTPPSSSPLSVRVFHPPPSSLPPLPAPPCVVPHPATSGSPTIPRRPPVPYLSALGKLGCGCIQGAEWRSPSPTRPARCGEVGARPARHFSCPSQPAHHGEVGARCVVALPVLLPAGAGHRLARRMPPPSLSSVRKGKTSIRSINLVNYNYRYII